MTYSEITKSMKRWEKLINFYNKRDRFDTETLGTEKEKREYKMALNVWDQLKIKRDQMKAA